jgi:Ca2+-transporting ATPase
MEYYSARLDEVFKELKSSKTGLSEEQARQALARYGPNELTEGHKISPLEIFVNQFKSFIVGILLVVLVISLAMGEIPDAIAVLVILVLNAVLGFIQEFKAEKAIEALKKMASPKAHVMRGGRAMMIDSKEVVPGDIILLTTGDKIPADARVIESVNLETQEAALTGESVPIEKTDSALKEGTPVANRANMVFSSTIVTKGHGRAIVAATGMATEFGKIAKLLESVQEEQTPLQKKLQELGKTLGVMSIVICLVIFIVSVLKDTNLLELIRNSSPIKDIMVVIKEPLKAAIALAVAAIPEGLPAVVTISLALGVQRMIRRNALIRKLPSVETLGSTTVICSDKTGTLTHNEMTVRKLFVNNRVVEVTGSGYTPEGSFSDSLENFRLLLTIGALNNDARIEEGKVIGDPTEGCLLVSAEKAGLKLDSLKREYPRVDEIPFESERKLMTTVHSSKGDRLAFTKGAPDNILKLCDRILVDGKVQKLTPSVKKAISEMNDVFSEEALRVLGFAYKEVRKEPKKEMEMGMIFVGLQAMIDPPREEVKLSIAKCKTAGIKVVMITGDYIGTARAIARELGIEGRAITGEELDNMRDFDKHVEEIGIYARVNPEHKMKIVEAFKKRGHVVAMTGDGVNDAPAIKNADIGIAMGITGTDVAKEASDVVLTDDNFSSIVNAVEEGRGIYANIKNFVQYLLSCNIGEVFVVLLGVLMGFPLILMPLQILIMNILTDGLPALALGVEPIEKGIMERKPRKQNERLFSRYSFLNIVSVGIIICAGTLFIFKRYVDTDPIKASAMAFTTLVVFQMFQVFNNRSEVKSVFSMNLLSNKYLIYAVMASLAIQVVTIYTPLSLVINKGQVFFTLADWALIVVVSSSVVLTEELIKRFVIKEELFNG